MAEKEEYERTIARLCGEVDAMRAILLSIAEILPERAMHHIAHQAATLRTGTDKAARNNPNDKRRDYAAGVWDFVAETEVLMEMRIDELENGARIRMLQPAPIPKAEQIFPEKGW
ncbi:MAG TPA: hypothetical protein VGV39_04765 [Mesorhizobium sp.]|jgi:hypothetical protein|uniref:hypothetical protein n=1 Tax=Mesorhizobium sp. TaxID=1871066 RepID=UPI002DDCD342|nr:hypothetical protein [Mesorhizobium sp.]HEV2502361.1 hypothetical protein [Mesorhizobium sp.]